MKNIKFFDKNISNTHKMKKTMDVLRKPRKYNSNYRMNITEPEIWVDHKSYRDQ